MSSSPMVCSNDELLRRYLTPEMKGYFAKKCPLDSEAELSLKLVELLKYLSLAHHMGSDIPVSFEIDDLWHLWILQTRDYQELMNKLPAGVFIHHSSKDYPNHMPISEEAILEQQLSFLASYYKNFGPFSEKTLPYWPMAQQLHDSFGSLEELHSLLEGLI